MHKNMHYKKIIIDIFAGHLPQGRCGLKSDVIPFVIAAPEVTFRKEGVD